jgi:hypothetical protein
MKAREYSEDLGVDGNVILEWIKEISWEGVDWIQLAQDRVRWLPLLNMVTNL